MYAGQGRGSSKSTCLGTRGGERVIELKYIHKMIFRFCSFKTSFDHWLKATTMGSFVDCGHKTRHRFVVCYGP